MPPRRQTLVTPPIARLFDEATAAAYLGLSERGFEGLWRCGSLPQPHRVGRRLLWDRKMLDIWADDLSGLGPRPNFFGDLWQMEIATKNDASRTVQGPGVIKR